MKLCCDKCNVALTFMNIGRAMDVDSERIGTHCKDCALEVENDLKQKRLVETYKGNDIFCKDGRYYPYWQSSYHYVKLDHVKKGIDDRYSLAVSQ